mgnify:CR=1 FL=1
MHITTQGWYNPPLSKVFGFRVFGNRRGLGGEPGPRCFPKPSLPLPHHLLSASFCRNTAMLSNLDGRPRSSIDAHPGWPRGFRIAQTGLFAHGRRMPEKAASSHHGVESPWWLLALKMKVVVLRLCSIAPSGRPARNRDGCEPMRLPATQQTEGLTHLSRSAIIEQRQRALPISRNRRLRFLSFLGFVPGVPPESITWFLS